MSEPNDVPTPLPAPQDGADPRMWRRFVQQQNLKGNADRTYADFVRLEEEKQRQIAVEAEVRRLAKTAAAAEATKGPSAPSNLFEGLDLGAITDLASILPPEWQAKFRREVARTKAYIAKFADADPVVPLIEEYVFLEFVVRAISIGVMAGRLDKKTSETIDIFLRRRTEMASALEITPEAKRKRGGATEETLAAALVSSQKAVADGRTGRQERRDRMKQVLDEKARDAVRAAAQKTDNVEND